MKNNKPSEEKQDDVRSVVAETDVKVEDVEDAESIELSSSTPDGVDVDIDTSMFSEKELLEINENIEHFISRLKEKEGRIIRNKLLSRPLKKVFLLPLIILSISIILLVFIASSYIRSSINVDGNNPTWIESLFAIRTSTEEREGISEATRELISGLRSEDEEQIVELFVDLINVENAERSIEEGRAPADAVRSNTPNEESQDGSGEGVEGAVVDNTPSPETIALQQQIETLKAELNEQIDNASIDTEELELSLQEQQQQFDTQQQNFQSLQDNFQSLSNRYDQANLQTDQYTSLVIQIDDAIGKRDFGTATSLLQQFDAFLGSRVIRNNPLLRDLLRTGPAFSNSVRLYLSSEASGQDAVDINVEKIRRLEEEIADRVVEIQQLNNRNQQLSIENRESEIEIENLQTKLEEDLNLARQQHEAEVDRLVTQYEAGTEALDSRHEAEIQALQDQHSTEIETLQGQHSTDIEALEGQYSTDIQVLQEQIDDGLVDAKQQYIDDTEALRTKFESDLATANREYNSEVEILRTQLQQVIVELQNIRRSR